MKTPSWTLLTTAVATAAMAGKGAKTRPALGLVKVAESLNQYGSHFDHPGFKPIRNAH